MDDVLSLRNPKNCPKCGVAPVVSQPPMREFDYVPCAMIYCCGLQFSSDSLVEALSGWNAVCIGYSQAIADLAQAPAPVRVEDPILARETEDDYALRLSRMKPTPAPAALRITGPNNDGEYWLHIKADGRVGGINLGVQHGPICKRLLDAASETGTK